MSKAIDLPKQYIDCPLYNRLLAVFEAKHKTKTGMYAALAASLNAALGPYGLKFDSDRSSVDGKHTFVGSAPVQTVLSVKGSRFDNPEYAHYSESYSPQDAASRLCARIALMLEDFLFSHSETFGPLSRCTFTFPALPTLAKSQRDRFLFLQDAAAKVYTLESVLPVPNHVSSIVKSMMRHPGIADMVDVDRLNTPLKRHQFGYYNYNSGGFGQVTASTQDGHPGAFNVSDDLKTRWLSVSSWSERAVMLCSMEREYMRAFTVSLHAVVTAMVPTVCDFYYVNPAKTPDDYNRAAERKRIQEFAEFMYHNARPAMQALEQFTRDVLEGKVEPAK